MYLWFLFDAQTYSTPAAGANGPEYHRHAEKVGKLERQIKK